MIKNTFNSFFRLEAAGGILLLVATIAAMILKNSPLGELYATFLNVPIQIRIGPLDIDKPLFLWVNDGLMAMFFFMIGMEVKREIMVGELSDIRQVILPGMAGIGGIVFPAIFYYLVNSGDDLALQGWAIPTATDIAFALGVLALVGNVPTALKLFLMTLAIIDDVGAIVIIAIFYTTELSIFSLVAALLAITVLIWMKLKRWLGVTPYLIVGILLWVSVLKSGVHATLAGVILGLFIPMTPEKPGDDPPLERLLHTLHPWVAFCILPMFAFVNSGVNLEGVSLASLFEPIPLGTMLGLVIGKQVGIFSFAWLSIKTGIAALPRETTMLQVYGASVLCGIGFTMSLFIASLAFEESGIGFDRPDRLGILAGSLICGVLGFLILKFAGRNQKTP